MATEPFKELMQALVEHVDERALDDSLQTALNQELPPDSELFKSIFKACEGAIVDGWMCNREAGGILFGRVIKPHTAIGAYSVDVVRMEDVVGPHHAHPNGEIDMVMPLTEGALFDGHGAGWKVYEAGSAHSPTVTGGAALVLYLLPEGAIEFT